MHEDKVSLRSVFCLLVVMLISSNIILGYPEESGRDTWISLLIAFCFALPMVLIYGRLIQLFPGKNIYDMSELVFGKRLGKVISGLFSFFCIIFAGMMPFYLSIFVHMTALMKTNIFIICFLFVAVGGYLAIKGTAIIGKFSIALFIVVTITMAFLMAISHKNFDVRNLLPILSHSSKDIFKSGLKFFLVPMGHISLALGISDSFKKPEKGKKLVSLSLAVGTLYIVIVFIRVCCTIGSEAMHTLLFQVYRSVAILKMSDFFERIESIVAFIYTLMNITKFSVVLLSATNGVKSIFSLKSSRNVLFSVTLCVYAFSMAPFKGAIEMMDFIKVFYYFAFFFQVIIPMALWITAELKRKKNKPGKEIMKIERELDLAQEKLMRP